MRASSPARTALRSCSCSPGSSRSRRWFASCSYDGQLEDEPRRHGGTKRERRLRSDVAEPHIPLRSPLLRTSADRSLGTPMKPSMAGRGCLLVAMLSGGLFGGTVVAASKAKPPRTVVDYYMLLPERYFEVDRRGL